MKTKNNIFFKMLFCLMFCFAMIFTVNSESIAADTITVTQTAYTIFQPNGNAMRVVFKLDNKGEPVYCLESVKALPENQTVMSDQGKISDSAVIQYIIENAAKDIKTLQKNAVGETTNRGIAQFYVNNYENTHDGSDIYLGAENASKVEDSEYDTYVKTQLAIWYYYGNGAIYSSYDGTNLMPVIQATYTGIPELVNKAKKATATPDLTINLSGDSNLSLSDDEQYYVSGPITVSANRSVTVNLTATSSDATGIEIINSSGSKISSISSGNTIKVRVPSKSVSLGTTNITLSASATATRTSIHKYVSSSNVQSVGRLKSEPYSAIKNLNLSSTKKSKVLISKFDITGQNELPGAHLQIEDKDGNVVKNCKDDKGNNNAECKWISTDKPYEIEGLPVGTYYLVETLAPEGYVLNKEKKEFSIENNTDVKKVEMTNKVNKVIISKTDITGKDELPGAHLQIEDKDGNIIKYCKDESVNNNAECKWISTDKPYEIEGLPVGTYYLVETLAPEGYVLNKEKIEFTVKEGSEVEMVQMTNDLEVEVPDTLSARSALLLTIAMIDIALGIGIITYVKKNKIKE